jgi:hypothetical protein
MEKDKDFESFGYDTDKPCEICGKKPAKLEPRFFYSVCKEHQYLTPIEVLTTKK